ncbi:MAG: L,D-transpeptidase family protein, partial [Thermodesulfobacteriota bacterium]
AQIELNMERLRWLPQNLGSRYILVNLANFELYVNENNKKIMSMRVIVGKPYWNTPVFTAKMTYLVLNPHWNIPQTIFAEEKLPKIKKDPEYFSKDNIKVLSSWRPNAEVIDPSTIDWSKVTDQNFRFRLRQEPGPGNPLGRVKFMFPNAYHVYLHDTSQKYLFNKTERNLSHGCIRIEKPYELAAYVLGSDPGRIRAMVSKGLTKNVGLPEPIPVYLVYFTAWVHEDGSIEFRNDIYRRDETLYQALRETRLTI